jgi:hypothetical protein
MRADQPNTPAGTTKWWHSHWQHDDIAPQCDQASASATDRDKSYRRLWTHHEEDSGGCAWIVDPRYDPGRLHRKAMIVALMAADRAAAATRPQRTSLALAHERPREMIHALALRPHSISELAARQGLTLPAIHKHIRVLEGAGMVRLRKTGRTTFLALRREPLGRL